jgi:hypothetical protein
MRLSLIRKMNSGGTHTSSFYQPPSSQINIDIKAKDKSELTELAAA